MKKEMKRIIWGLIGFNVLIMIIDMPKSFPDFCNYYIWESTLIPYYLLIPTGLLVSLFEFTTIVFCIDNFKKACMKILFLVSVCIKNAVVFSFLYIDVNYFEKSGCIDNAEQARMFMRKYMINPVYYILLLVMTYSVYSFFKKQAIERERFAASLVIYNLIAAIIVFFTERVLCYGSFQ